MCCDWIDWTATGTMLIGIGTALIGIAAMLALWFQWGATKKLAKIEPDLKEFTRERLILDEFNKFYASEDGISLDFPRDIDVIVDIIAIKTGLDVETITNTLNHFYRGRIITG